MSRVLFLHDQQTNPRTRRQYLETVGFDVAASESGETCIELIEEHAPDVIIIDVLLHGPNGFEVCRRIRELYSPEELPVIICAGVFKRPAYRDVANDVGAQAFHQAPITTSRFIRTVRILAERATFQRRLRSRRA